MVANFRKRIVAAAVLALSLFPTAAKSQRYNTETRVLAAPTKEEIAKGRETAELPSSAAPTKDWEPLLNPAYEEFWTEGNHKPDAGFILFARNPTPANAKLWLLRMETKAKVVTKMYSMIEAAQSELIASGQMVDRYNVMSKGRRIGTDTVKGKSQFSKDVVIYLVFAPTCSICHRMAKVLAPIKDQVVALQVPTQIPLKSAAEGLVNLEGLNPSTWADADTMQRYVRGKVPVILVYSKKSDQVAKLEGAQPLEEIMKVAAYVSNQKG